jgi:hypothetical protein
VWPSIINTAYSIYYPQVTFNATIPGPYTGSVTAVYQSTVNQSVYVTVTVSATGTFAPPPVQGYVNPKYIVIGVIYASPGGNNSNVSYQNTSFVGNTSVISNSFSSNYTFSVAISSGSPNPNCQDGNPSITGLFGFSAGACVTGSESTSYTQTSGNSKSVTLSKQVGVKTQVSGVPAPYSPYNHDYDQVLLWLNPVVVYTVGANNTSSSGTIQWNGYGYDYNYPLHEMEVWPIYVGYLNGDFGPISPQNDPQDYDVLQRSWVTTQTFAPGQSAAITSADYPNILGADPFAYNPNYLVTLASGVTPATTTDGRFTQADTTTAAPETFFYKQAHPTMGGAVVSPDCV